MLYFGRKYTNERHFGHGHVGYVTAHLFIGTLLPFSLQRDMKISSDIRYRVLAYYEYLVNTFLLYTLYLHY